MLECRQFPGHLLPWLAGECLAPLGQPWHPRLSWVWASPDIPSGSERKELGFGFLGWGKEWKVMRKGGLGDRVQATLPFKSLESQIWDLGP